VRRIESHPKAGFLLFILGIGYAVFILAGFFGVWWASSFFSTVTYPMNSLIPSGSSAFWPLLAIPLYLAIPDIVITLALVRLKAGALAMALGLLTAFYVVAFTGFFLILAAAMG
jgi:hypothetical protein